jgi:methylated-DNA-[protein]-cysteine S-methyltransferase
MREPTAFERRIYALAQRIPSGRVSTYGELARAAGCGSARAVGQALSRNPFARAGRKLELLAGEGVLFAAGRLADASRLFLF